MCLRRNDLEPEQSRSRMSGLARQCRRPLSGAGSWYNLESATLWGLSASDLAEIQRSLKEWTE